MWDDGLYISPRYRREDYTNLNLSTRSGEQTWNTAIDIFEDRIRGRFLDVVKDLMNRTDKTRDQFSGYSFSIMAIECLLIETLQQFYNGSDSTDSPNRDAFVAFFTRSEYFAEYFNIATAKVFYGDIRCGILHQAQTKRNTQLTYIGDQMVERINNGIRVNVELFSNALFKEFDDYVDSLRSGDIEIREKFINKMNYIVTI